MASKEIHVMSPGRINLMGDHTDYMGGYVLPAAIGQGIRLRVRENILSGTIRVTAEDFGETHIVQIGHWEKVDQGWQNYITGVLAEVHALHRLPSGVDISFSGDVPIGSGMSSSAALESSLAFALNVFFDLKISRLDLIKACQRAEHNYAGIQCGIMDQFASMMGKQGHAILLDCQSLEYQYYPIKLGEYQIILLNTKVSHQLADSEYNIRRESCESGLKKLQSMSEDVHTMRDVSLEVIDRHKEDLGELLYQKCKHVVTENQRVLDATKAITNKDIKALGELMYLSHESLSEQYEVSCKELDYLVDQTRDNSYVLGARMMGGGFGGCTINIVHQSKVEHFIKEMGKNYFERFGITLEAYSVSIENGTHILNK